MGNVKARATSRARRMRRSKRLALRVAIAVYEVNGVNEVKADPRFIVDDTYAVMVSRHGAMILLGKTVKADQKLLLVNKITNERRECRVAYLGSHRQGKQTVGVEFTEPAPDFWGLSFPTTKPSPLKQAADSTR